MPALLTSTSMPPSSFAASATMRSICARSPTLQMPIFNPLISVAADFNASALMSHVYTSAPERMNAAAMCFPIPEAPAVTRTLRDMGDLQNPRVEPVDALTDAIHPNCLLVLLTRIKGRIPVHSRATQHHAQRIDSLCRGAIFFRTSDRAQLTISSANGVAFCTCDLATTTLCVALKLKIFLEPSD